MVSDSNPSGRPILTLDDLARPLTQRPERIHALTSSELAVAFSLGLDLAEGKPIGHAQRVCYIATLLADALALEPAARSAVYFGALLHDIGVTLAASDICRVAGIDEDTIFGPAPLKSVEELRADLSFADLSSVVDAVQQHSLLGAETIQALDLPIEVAAAVSAHHERWDGFGFPEGISGETIPIEARVLAVADVAESLIAIEASSLSARRRLAPAIGRYVAVTLDPGVVSRAARSRTLRRVLARALLRRHARDPARAAAADGVAQEPEARAALRRSLRRHRRRQGRPHDRPLAAHCGRRREALGGIGLDPGHIEMIRIAALLHDVGLLGVPASIMSKPDILSVTEMQLMRQHPSNSEMVLRPLNGFEEIAFWVERHHERPDGKGYPEMLTGDELPLESRILAVADVYSALIAERSYRGAVTHDDAKQILLGAAGTQLDAELVRHLRRAVVDKASGVGVRVRARPTRRQVRNFERPPLTAAGRLSPPPIIPKVRIDSLQPGTTFSHLFHRPVDMSTGCASRDVSCASAHKQSADEVWGEELVHDRLPRSSGMGEGTSSDDRGVPRDGGLPRARTVRIDVAAAKKL